MAINNLTCCGMRELFYLSDNQEALAYQVARGRNQGEDFVFVVFSDANSQSKGKALAKYIIKNKLGTVVETNSRKNPNTGNRIRAWIWELNQNKVSSFYNKVDKKILKLRESAAWGNEVLLDQYYE